MTVPVANSLGMTEPYGAIFERPETGSPAASAGIAAGDVLTAINGTPLTNWRDFATTIAAISPGTVIYLSTSRNGEPMEINLTLGSGSCPRQRVGHSDTRCSAPRASRQIDVTGFSPSAAAGGGTRRPTSG